MTDSDIAIRSETLPLAAWPHARVDCPLVWRGASSPCANCFCYVCDVPLADCDDVAAHEPADGRHPSWTALKRRRRALANTWGDIPALVNLLVSLSVEEAAVRGSGRTGLHGSPTAIDDVVLGIGGGEQGVRGQVEELGAFAGLSIKHDDVEDVGVIDIVPVKLEHAFDAHTK